MTTKLELDDASHAIVGQLRRTRERTVGGLRQLRRALSRELRARSGKEILSLTERLIDAGIPRWFAYELAHHHRDARAQLTAAWLRRLGEGLGYWYEVDPFGLYLLGPAWREGHVSDAEILRWARSRDRWRRRTALVATVALNNTARGGTGDAPRTLLVCDVLVADRDDMVVKAMSWALRALAGPHPELVKRYLKQHESELAARVLREVRNKLTSGLKNPKRKL
jgi:hypothetical protein